MLEKLRIKNFKSIIDDTINLGKVNVFIGENGSGKSNILEALMFASIAETYETLDADILYTNGFRVAKPSLILSSFKNKEQINDINISLGFSDAEINCLLKADNKNSIYSKWSDTKQDLLESIVDKVIKSQNPKDEINEFIKTTPKNKTISEVQEYSIEFIKKYLELKQNYRKSQIFSDLNNFIVYTLNTEALRGTPEFQRSRKGIYGENLDQIIGELNTQELEELKEYMYTISWLEDFFIDANDENKQKGYKLNHSKSLLYFKDKYMKKENNVFSSENSNEGILHVLFYLVTIISDKTPRLFAIDNIETALNPHLCQHTMFEISKLAKNHDKQILITTHNPAILDGLDLFDDDIRLFETFRTDDGDTKTRRIQLKPEVKDAHYKLSELWTRGHLGAISDKF